MGKKNADGKVCRYPMPILPGCCLVSSLSAHICMMEAAAIWLTREGGLGGVGCWLSWLFLLQHLKPLPYQSPPLPSTVFKLEAPSKPLLPSLAGVSYTHFRQWFLSSNSTVFVLSGIPCNVKSTEVTTSCLPDHLWSICIYLF